MVSLYVINSRGEKELFSFQKVYQSAMRVGASKELARHIAKTIQEQAYPGITTLEVFKKVKKLLRQKTPRAAIKFNLKQGMRKLGPTGFPFEKFIGGIFERLGFRVKINQYLPGFCIKDYEIDFLAEKDNLIYVGECKYRSAMGERVHSKDALAGHARFLDILKGPYFKSKKYKNFKIKDIIVTNAKFTARTIGYSYCVNTELLGWKCPKNKGLEYLIEQEDLYPITILPYLGGFLKNIFVLKKMMLVQDVLKIDPQSFAKEFKIPVERFNSLMKQARILLDK